MEQSLRPYWILPQLLGGCRAPEGPAEVRHLADAGVRLLVTLTERPLPPSWAVPGLEQVHCPTPDLGAPSPEQLHWLLPTIDKAVRRGMPVIVHCQLGRGRAGTVLAAYLVFRGIEPPAALAYVQRVRQGAAASAWQQEAVLRTVHLRSSTSTLPPLQLPNLDGTGPA